MESYLTSDKKGWEPLNQGTEVLQLKIKYSVEVTDEDIFLPHVVGQYDGRSKPLPEYHAKITGFDERVCFHCR